MQQASLKLACLLDSIENQKSPKKPQFHPQISQINADFHVFIHSGCITTKVNNIIIY
jgi:hypothetical protein